MPRDANPNKRKAHEAPTLLFDNAARSFLSRRFIEVDASDISSVRSSRVRVQSFVTPGPQPPLYGNLEEDIYAMPNPFDTGNNADAMEIVIDTAPFLGRPRGNSLTPEGESIPSLPGVKITQRARFKRYANSVCHLRFALSNLR